MNSAREQFIGGCLHDNIEQRCIALNAANRRGTINIVKIIYQMQLPSWSIFHFSESLQDKAERMTLFLC